MINNWDRQKLDIDFSRIELPRGKPSDIDFVYVGPQGNDGVPKYAILAEIKNSVGTFTEFQRYLYAQYSDALERSGIDTYTMYLNHDKFVERGDTEVNVADCLVVEVYDTNDHLWYTVSDEKLLFQTALDMILSKYK